MFRVSSFAARILQVLAATFIAAASSFAANVTLAWDPNAESDLAGYRLHYGTAPGTYTQSIDVGTTTTAAVPSLLDGTTYYFVVTAYNTATQESPWSNEITHTTATPPNAPPTVALTAPANGSTYLAPASITLAASAADSDGAVARVEFYQGTNKLGEDTSSPYAFTWNGVTPGTYALSARAIDNLGAATASTSVTVTVSQPNQAPTVSITSPASGASFTAPANITINASALDSDGTVTRVEFYNGATKLGESTSSPFAFSWNGVAAGDYQFTARATDDDGATTTSTVVNVSVRAPNQPPTVAMTAPVNGAIVHAPADITMTASASDSDGSIARVEFYRGPVKLGEDTTAPYSYTWTAAPAGSYTLTAIAIDNASASATSAVVNVTVNATPIVTLATDGTSFTAPASIALTATPVDSDGSIAKVEFYNGTTKLGEATSSPYTFAWNNVAAGNYPLTARATDNRGGASTSAAVNVTVRAPNQSPTVAMTAPVDGAIVHAPGDLAIAASASDADGSIARVEFYRGNIKLGEDTTAPYAYIWTAAPAGTYALTAVAIDNENASTTSAIVNVTVNALPTVTLTTSGTSFPAPASVTLTATPEDSDGTIAKVEFYNGPTKLGEATSSPYTFAWNDVPAGNYSLTARAADDRGGTSTSAPVSIAVTAPNQPPTVAISTSSTPNPPIAPATITISATASDADGTIARVDFYQGSTKLGEDATSPHSFNWTNVPAGTHTLTAVAIDNAGATATSTPVTVTVQAGPNVVLTTNGTTFSPGSTIVLTASTSQLKDRVRRVDFYRGSVQLYRDSKAPYTYSWKSVPAGTYSLTAVAVMTSGIKYTSTPVQVTVGTAQIGAMQAVASSYEDPMPTVTPNLQPDGTLSLGITGQYGQTYNVWVSTDLKEWTLMTTVTNLSGSVSVTDSDAPAHKQRFYRVSVQ